MSGGRVRFTTLLAWSLWSLAALLTVSAVPLEFANGGQGAPQLLLLGFGVTFSTAGALIASRRPANPMGWLLIAVSLLWALANLARSYAIYGLLTRPGSLPGAVFMAWLEQWPLWFVFPSGIALILLLFPTGRPPSRRWWPVVWLTIAGALLMVIGSMFGPGQLGDALHDVNGPVINFGVQNPLGIGPLRSVLVLMDVVGRLGGLLLAPVAAAGLLVRLLRSEGEEREQLKWVAYVGALIILGIVGLIVFSPFPALQNFAFVLVIGGLFVGLPGAAAIGILKYRLYDIDVVINRSLLFGALAGFITAVYVGIVVGVGSIIGTHGRPNLGLSIVATAIVAFAFQPVRERVERIANRLVYGKRATPYEVLSQFTERVAGSYASEEILPKMAEVLAEGTGAARADVWLRLGDHIAPAAAWPSSDGFPRASVTLAGDLLPAVPTVTRVVPVRHQGELFGALSINKRQGETLTPVEEGLLKDLAAEAGLVLRNVRLTAELQARLTEISQQAAELRASRQRIVAAQDAERRRLERNIHDGAQQHLVALTVKLRLAASQAKKDAQRAGQMVRALETETDEALQTLRDLARGIYPPVLREKGLVAALQAQVDRMELPVQIEANGIDRYSSEAEGAVYFTCLEALQNVAKHAGAGHVELTLEQQDSALLFSVIDDGKGFNPDQVARGAGLRNMADRIEALGGSFQIGPARNGGTAVRGSIPLPVGLRRT